MATARGGAVQVAVAQSQQLIAEGLACAVQVQGLNVRAVHHSPTALLDEICSGGPDVVVLDLGLVPTDALGLLVSDIRAAAPSTRILLLADQLDDETVRTALGEEIDGLVLKTASVAELTSAVRQVAAGSQVLPRGFLSAARRTERRSSSTLSSRQREVLALLAEGLSNEDIAERLFISPNTVRFHVREIYHRLGVHNRVQAARQLSESPAPD